MSLKTQPSVSSAPARRHGFFLHRQFAWLWLAQSISGFGSRITREGLPLAAALTLHATAVQMGWLAASGLLPLLIVGLFAGVMVDRLPRRPILIVADLGRAVLLCSIPLLAMLGRLGIESLYLVAALVGILTVFFEVAYRSYLPTLLRHEDLMEGNSKLETSDALAEIGGPIMAGLLVQLLTTSIAILFDALSFLISAFCVSLIRLPAAPHESHADQQRLWRDLSEGWLLLFRDPLLRALAAYKGTRSFFGGFFATLYVLYVVRVLGVAPVSYGLLVMMGGVGGVMGALLATRMLRHYGIGRTLIGTALLAGAVSFTTPLAGGSQPLVVALLMFSQLVGDGSITVYSISTVSLLQMNVPDHYLGRVNACVHLLENGLVPMGALLAGLLAGIIGVRLTLLISAGGQVVACVWLFLSPLRREK